MRNAVAMAFGVVLIAVGSAAAQATSDGEAGMPAALRPNVPQMEHWQIGDQTPTEAAPAASAAPVAPPQADRRSPLAPTVPSVNRPPANRQQGGSTEGGRYTDALNTLMANGYERVDSIRPDGDSFRARASFEGRRVEVRVNPEVGAVTQLGAAP